MRLVARLNLIIGTRRFGLMDLNRHREGVNHEQEISDQLADNVLACGMRNKKTAYKIRKTQLQRVLDVVIQKRGLSGNAATL